MQRCTIDAGELKVGIQRNSVRRRPGVDIGGRGAAAEPALDAIERQRLAVALDRAADRPQLDALRQRAA